jgi:uncharacterized protein (DUF1800 family)
MVHSHGFRLRVSHLQAPDQLRQRVAWALAQIVVVGEMVGSQYAEPRLTFYDIFVRNAFGNYRDILREASFSPTMGLYLSFMGSKSFAASGTVSCPVLGNLRVRVRLGFGLVT